MEGIKKILAAIKMIIEALITSKRKKEKFQTGKAIVDF
jgi:hypothetical protein